MAASASRKRKALMQIAMTAAVFNYTMFSQEEWFDFCSMGLGTDGFVELMYPGGMTLYSWRITQKGFDFINAAS
jgi:hypothetical protein